MYYFIVHFKHFEIIFEMVELEERVVMIECIDNILKDNDNGELYISCIFESLLSENCFNNEKYSQNKNGVMFDLMKFSAKTVDEINNFIKYIENNSLLVEHDEETRNIFRTLLN